MTTTTNHTGIEKLVRQTAERLEAEGAFCAGDPNAPVPPLVQTHLPIRPTDHGAMANARARFRKLEDRRLSMKAAADAAFIFPLISNTGGPDVFVFYETDSPIRLKVKLSGETEVVSASDPVRKATGVSIDLGGHPILMLLRTLFTSEEEVSRWLAYELKWGRYL